MSPRKESPQGIVMGLAYESFAQGYRPPPFTLTDPPQGLGQRLYFWYLRYSRRESRRQKIVPYCTSHTTGRVSRVQRGAHRLLRSRKINFVKLRVLKNKLCNFNFLYLYICSIFYSARTPHSTVAGHEPILIRSGRQQTPTPSPRTRPPRRKCPLQKSPARQNSSAPRWQ